MSALPLRVTYRNVSPQPEVGAAIRRRSAKLIEMCPRISNIEVAIELPHRHRLHGRQFRVRILIQLPGETLVVNRNPVGLVRHERLDAALTDAYHAARRELRDHLAVRRNFRHEGSTQQASPLE